MDPYFFETTKMQHEVAEVAAQLTSPRLQQNPTVTADQFVPFVKNPNPNLNNPLLA